jgi:oligopeptide transport system substrate-binding protein
MKLLSLVILLTLSTACTKKNARNLDEINVALGDAVSTVDPANCYDTVCAEPVYQIFETLFEYNYTKRPFSLQPLLADGMPTISKDGTLYTFKIKKGVFFHDLEDVLVNRELEAQDFINQLKRLAFKGTGSNGWWLFENKIKGLDEFRKTAKDDFSDFFTKDVSGLKALDKHTLQIDLVKPYPQLMYALAMTFSSPTPAELITHFKNELLTNPIGTGPYKLDTWVRKSKLKLSAFSKYHSKKPQVKKLTFHIIKEKQSQWLNFLNKKIDFIKLGKDEFALAITKEGKLEQEYAQKDIELLINPTLTFWWLSFNMTDPILGKNAKLRRAIAHAVNNDELIELFTNNVGLKAGSIYPPGILGHSDKKPAYKYDVELAKKLMNEAGYPKGKGLPEIVYDVRGNSTNARQRAEFIKKELDKIGIKVKVNLNTFPGFLEKARKGQLQFYQGGWAMDYPDSENIVQLLVKKSHPPGPNDSFYTNPKVEKLYNKLAAMNDSEAKAKIAQEIEEIIFNDTPWVMQYYVQNYILKHKNVKNLNLSDLVNNYYKYVTKE